MNQVVVVDVAQPRHGGRRDPPGGRPSKPTLTLDECKLALQLIETVGWRRAAMEISRRRLAVAPADARLSEIGVSTKWLRRHLVRQGYLPGRAEPGGSPAGPYA